jgi:hypothetical protein
MTARRNNRKRKPATAQVGWQVFRQTGTRPHTMQSGRRITLLCYEAHCAGCGVHFDAAATPTNWKRRYVCRRCDDCRDPGQYVDNLAPPVSIASLPVWARPKRDTKSLKASLGRRSHNCRYIGKGRLRIVEPREAQAIRDHEAAERAAVRARLSAAKRPKPAPAPALAPASAHPEPTLSPNFSFLD